MLAPYKEQLASAEALDLGGTWTLLRVRTFWVNWERARLNGRHPGSFRPAPGSSWGGNRDRDTGSRDNGGSFGRSDSRDGFGQRDFGGRFGGRDGRDS